ncbi:hypothetical protein LCGC14_1971980, partial [marine sediment metagenome]
MYFVCSMGDLFHESAPFEWIDKIFAVMALCPQHTFQVLTKRPERMAEYFNKENEDLRGDGMAGAMCDWIAGGGLSDDMLNRWCKDHGVSRKWRDKINDNRNIWCNATWQKPLWSLPNVWLGTTAENQEMADERIPHLLKCPAAKHFVSIEPMLSEVKYIDYVIAKCPECGRRLLVNRDISDDRPKDFITACSTCMEHRDITARVDWVICGGESGPGARPMRPDWARSVRDQCKAAGVPFFFKQWGAWLPLGQGGSAAGSWIDNSRKTKGGEPIYKVTDGYDNLIGYGISYHFEPEGTCYRIGKKKAGSLLDGKQHKEYPT